MATTTTFPRASTRTFLFWTIHVVEMVVDVDGIETVGPVVSIHPDAASAQTAAQAIPTTTVSD